MSAVSKTIKGDLPPNSIVKCLPEPAVPFLMIRPTSVEPVNVTFQGTGCSYSIVPVLESPVSTFTTPGGSFTSFMRMSARRSADIGVDFDGLITTVFPAAIAGAIFQASIRKGKFQGTICAITPPGRYPGNSLSNVCAQPA